MATRAKRGRARGRSTRGSQRPPVVGQSALAQPAETSDTTLGNLGTDGGRRKRPRRGEPPSTIPPSDARETSTNTGHSDSLTKDDIPTIVDAVIRALPNTALSQERTPTGPSSPSEPQQENSSTGAQALTDTQERDHLPPPGENFSCL